MIKSKISLCGYDLIGEYGNDGIRYAWNYNNKKQLLESAAFPYHRKGVYDNICGYTTSVSLGCILKAFNLQCSFCRTGNLLPFSDNLSAFDIAKQNIFMVLSDVYCSDHKELINMPKEFAYMGQGEPGYSYSQLREAIRITNIVMKNINQKVYRHIISTSGVPEMIKAVKDDIKNGFYSEKITLHFSLHSTSLRKIIMPIDKKYSFIEVLSCLEDVVEITGEKPCIGILLFNEYSPHGKQITYTNDINEVKEMLKFLDPKKFRLSFCEFNDSAEVGQAIKYPKDDAINILAYSRKMGFESKLFSSFGQREKAACGMLGGTKPEKESSEKWRKLERKAEELLENAINS